MKNHYFAHTFIGIISLASAMSAVAQTTRTVCTSGCDYSTIQAAMTAAASGDTILLNVTGTFTEKDIAIPEKNLVVKGLGKTTTILQSAATAASGSGGRIFSYLSPAGAGNNSFTVQDMTIQNAYAPVTSGNQAIGGVLYSIAPKGFKVSFRNVKMYKNQTQAGASNNSGGACVYISATGTGFTYNADLSLINCDLDDNYLGNPVTNSWGACLSLLGSPARLTVNNCSFTNNTAYNGGGAIYCGSNWVLNIKNSKFDNNTYRSGTSGGDGGCFKSSSGNWNFENCLFSGNKALLGNGYGGVFSGAGGKFKSCTFLGNQAIKGGAIYRSNSGFAVNGNLEMQLINCTFYGNQASGTGKTIHYGSTATGTFPLVMINTIITGGTGTATNEFHFVLPYAQFTTNQKNYCTSIGTENVSPGAVPVFDFNAGNTTLGLSTSLADNGGNMQSLALAATSTLINAGTNATGSTYDIPIKDQRNFSRPDGAIDVGSFEYNGLADDASVPVITYTALSNTLLTTDRTITATIADVNGVYWYPQTTDYRPRIYFKKNTGGWNSAVGSLSTGDGTNGSWTFTISSAAMGGLSNGDQVYYYIIAQDVSSSAGITSSPAGVDAADVNSITAHPSPQTYIIGAVLPVKIQSFTAQAGGSNALLDWIVNQEINVASYIIERSVNGTSWANAGSLQGSNGSHYSFTDAGLATGIYYYRLKIVDRDGNFSHSSYRLIKIGNNKAPFTIMGNRVTNGTVQLQLNDVLVMSLYETNGQLLWTKQLAAGQQSLDVSRYPKGLYFLKAAGQVQKIQVQ